MLSGPGATISATEAIRNRTRFVSTNTNTTSDASQRGAGGPRIAVAEHVSKPGDPRRASQDLEVGGPVHVQDGAGHESGASEARNTTVFATSSGGDAPEGLWTIPSPAGQPARRSPCRSRRSRGDDVEEDAVGRQRLGHGLAHAFMPPLLARRLGSRAPHGTPRARRRHTRRPRSINLRPQG